jgi:hypothetical protein
VSEYTLFSRQKEVESKLMAGSMVLNWDMRLGKTRAVLHAFDQLAFRGGPSVAIIICPSIAKGVWENELREMGLALPGVILDGNTNLRYRRFGLGALDNKVRTYDFEHEQNVTGTVQDPSVLISLVPKSGRVSGPQVKSPSQASKPRHELVTRVVNHQARQVSRTATASDTPLAIDDSSQIANLDGGELGQIYTGPLVGTRHFPQIILCNWEIVDSWLPVLQEIAPDAVLVLDETHDHCCNPRNARYKAVRDLAMMADRVWELTGTLYRTSALDLHWQLRLLGPGHYPFYYMKTDAFGEKYAYPRYNQFKKRNEYKGIRPGTEAELINLPVIDRRLEEMTELPTEIPWWLDEGDSFKYDGGQQEGAMSRARSELSSLKAQRTVELIRRNNLHLGPLVVFGWHKNFIHSVARELGGAAIIDGDVPHEQKTRICREFAEHRIGIIVANIQAAGKSVDLATAKNAVFGEIDWVKATMAQAEARIRGPKQTRKPCYWYLLAMNSVDEFVWRSCLARGRDMKRLDAAKLA